MSADPAKTPRYPIPLALVVFEGTKLLDVAGPLQVFSDARAPGGHPAYAVDILSEDGGEIATDTVCRLASTGFGAATGRRWDTVLISGGDAALHAARSASLQAFVAGASAGCRRLGSICLGAFILAAGGHLDGRRVTTHWDGSARLARDYPALRVEDDAIFIQDRGVWTSAGVTAGIDMALAMVEQDLGRGEALRLAKSLVLPMRRGGGQRQFSSALHAQINTAETRFAALISAMASDLRQNLSVAEMAAAAGMSERNFARVFAAELGVSPARFVERMRVEHASDLMHGAGLSLAAAQAEAGFSNAEQMRRAFQRCKGVAPSAYRARFFAPAPP
ncbi:MAG: helix-turn-helix domain-containing protein [Pseudomonadota bacterium]